MTATTPDRAHLEGDCERCVGLCCVALPFADGADFALDKDAGVPCPNLGVDHRCGIHDRLRPSGFSGCTAYDCFGAGQQISQVTFHGRDWRTDPDVAAPMFEAFRSMRHLHELLWYLTEALALEAARPVHGQLRQAIADIEAVAGGGVDGVTSVDVASLRSQVGPMLRRSADLARAGGPRKGVDRSGADLFGADLRGRDLRCDDLRNASLVGADLTGADLRGASLLGSDLRGADLAGADLRGALYATRMQLAAARGDATTRLPAGLERPAHW